MIRLLPFQELGRDFLVLRNNAILADDMGLGKTFQILEAIKKLGLQSGIILCPQSIRRSWVKRTREQIPLAFIKEITSPQVPPDPTAFNIVNYDIVRIFVLHEPGESVDPAGIGSESLFRIVSQPDRLAQTVENGGPPAWPRE